MFVHTYIGSATGLHVVNRHFSTVLTFTTVHVYGYSIYTVHILFHEQLSNFPSCFLVPRRSRQHKRRQAADNDVCVIDRNIEITIKISTLPGEWKRAIVVPIYKRNDRSAFTKYRPINLTTVLGKQVEHVTAEYLRQVWDKNDWLCEGQHGFRPGFSCESQVITVCQDTADFCTRGSV